MIDKKTREKFIKLKEDGCSNTEIKKTNVSQPPIRKIHKEADYENVVSDRSSALSPNRARGTVRQWLVS